MTIFVDETPRSSCQGLTGGQGRFYGLRNRAYGTQVVGGVTPGRAAPDVDGIPVFATVADAVAATGADRVVHRRAAEGRVGARCSKRPRPASSSSSASPRASRRRTRRWFYNTLERDFPGTRLLGPNCPGIISPGKCNIGITAGEIAERRAGPVGIVSRSGTLTYQALYELKQKGIGVTTCVGIGGDPVPGTSFIDCLERVRGRPRDQGRHDDRRDRRLGRGRGGRVHQGQR